MSKMQEVLDELPNSDPCSGIIGLMTNRRLNSTPGWRPSDAARAEMDAHRRLGCVAYDKEYREGWK